MEQNTCTTSRPPQLCILVLIGLPASGKSSFATFLSAFFDQARISSTIVSYDEEYSRLVAEKSPKNPPDFFDADLWHESRKQCLDRVENIVSSGMPADSQHVCI